MEGGKYLAALKYSRQRACIKEYLDSTLEHPTADIVYMNVKQRFPNISLGTVYRNLNLLAEIGAAQKISTPAGGDRFDGNVQPHYHFCCTSCGSVSDMEIEPMNQIIESASRNFEGRIEGHTMMFYGTCKECMKKK